MSKIHLKCKEKVFSLSEDESNSEDAPSDGSDSSDPDFEAGGGTRTGRGHEVEILLFSTYQSSACNSFRKFRFGSFDEEILRFRKKDDF